MVDALLSGGSGRKAVQVRVLSWAQQKYKNKTSIGDFRCFFYDLCHDYTMLIHEKETRDRTSLHIIIKICIR